MQKRSESAAGRKRAVMPGAKRIGPPAKAVRKAVGLRGLQPGARGVRAHGKAGAPGQLKVTSGAGGVAPASGLNYTVVELGLALTFY